MTAPGTACARCGHEWEAHSRAGNRCRIAGYGVNPASSDHSRCACSGYLRPVERNVPMTGVDLIAAERARQIAKGYTTEHDAEHGTRLGNAAVAYLTNVRLLLPWEAPEASVWDAQAMRERLAKAGALIAAAIDALPEETP